MIFISSYILSISSKIFFYIIIDTLSCRFTFDFLDLLVIFIGLFHDLLFMFLCLCLNLFVILIRMHLDFVLD